MILQASGIIGPFFLQTMCRTLEDKKERANSTTIQWLPKKSFADAQVIWYVLADNAPPDTFFDTKDSRILVQEVKQQPAAKVPTRPPNSSRTKPSASTAPTASSDAGPFSPKLEQRFQQIEKRLGLQETKLSEVEAQLTKRLDDGFSQVLSQLATFAAPALTDAQAQGYKRSEPPTGTPFKNGPKKYIRRDP